MHINPFHIPEEPPPDRPMRFYGLVVEDEELVERNGKPGRYLVVDLIGADWFDRNRFEIGDGLASTLWRNALLGAPVAVLEVNTRRRPAARQLLERPDLAANLWREFQLSDDSGGGGELFRNMFGAAEVVGIELKDLSEDLIEDLQKSGALDKYEVSNTATILAKLSSLPIEYVSVYDVGQGLAQGLTDSMGSLQTYVDLGGGVTADAGTWSPALTGFCFCNNPTVILSHWHYDHFSSANRFPAAHSLDWIAPNQPLGAGAQASFAAAVITHGNLSIWPTTVSSGKSSGGLTIEQCTGTVQNTSGLAVILDDPGGRHGPIVLTGDAGYRHIASLRTSKPFSFVVPHHGGAAAGVAITDPGYPNSRAVISCGVSNSYGHPLQASKTKLTNGMWSLGSPGARLDDRYSEDLRPGLGHVGMRWGGAIPAIGTCRHCASPIAPTQW